MIALFVVMDCHVAVVYSAACHSTCLGCTGAGIDLCIECKPGYHRSDLNHCIGTYLHYSFSINSNFFSLDVTDWPFCALVL